MVYACGVKAGELLKASRLERGLDQAGLARRSGTTQNYISRVERGVISPSVRTLERLMHALGCRLVLDAELLPFGNATASDLCSDFRDRTAEERVHEAMELSSFLTGVGAAAAAQERVRDGWTSRKD
jgi:transcriptional regulator with XRE-family HTH domain